MATRLPIDERLDTAGDLVARARIFYDIWRFYEGAETRPANLGAMNQYSEFFKFDTHAHFLSFIVYIAALLEARGDTINFPALIGEFERTKLIAPEIIAEARTILAQVEPLRLKVIILRSNLFAHRSASLSYAEAFAKAKLTPNQLRDLTDLALRLANRLLVERGLQEQFFHEPSLEHAKAMLQKLGATNVA